MDKGERDAAHSVGSSALLRYRFDNLVARGPIALIAMLGLASALTVVIAAALVASFGMGGSLPFTGLVYRSLLHAIDTGTQANDTGNGWATFVDLMVTFAGIFVVSSFIGIITTGMDRKLEELRRGRSTVLERGHTLILGWSPKIFTAISELSIANENQSHRVVVVLGQEDKVTMEEEIKERIPDLRGTRVVCRTGSPMDLADLRIVRPESARSIIILPPDVKDRDAQVIKTLLALVNSPERVTWRPHIVAEVDDPLNLEVAKIAGQDAAEIILGTELTARIMVQTCRQSGLSSVYKELLDFDGDEIYFSEEPRVVGRKFAEVLALYEDSTIIGIRAAEGFILLNPPMEREIANGDRLIAISEDDDRVVLSSEEPPETNEASMRVGATQQEVPERTLILGWNSLGPTVLRELDNYVPAGSETLVVADGQLCPGLTRPQEGQELDMRGLKGATIRGWRPSRYELNVMEGDTSSRLLLNNLDLSSFDHLIVLAYRDALTEQEADAKTLTTLLHLREMRAQKEAGDFSLVTQMLDGRNRDLAETARVDDFIVSDQLVSLLMTQISENRELATVFEDLFRSEGSEIYLKPVDRYVQLGTPVSFYTVTESACRLNEVAVGYRRAQAEGSEDAIVVNPRKSEPVTFQSADKIIVLSES